MTLHYKITVGIDDHATLDPSGWKALTNCTDRGEAVGIAAQKFLRERYGGLAPEALTFTVYHYTEDTPKHPNGRPLCVEATVMQAIPQILQKAHLN